MGVVDASHLGSEEKPEFMGTKLEQALGQPLYLLGPVCLDQEVPAGEFYKRKLKTVESQDV